MPRGYPKQPTPLDHFTDVDFQCLQKVMDTGRIDIIFNTNAQAMNTKARLWRLRDSLEKLRPDHPLSLAAKTFVYKRHGNRLTIIARSTSEEYAAQLEAIQGKLPDGGLSAIADREEREQALANEAFRKEFLDKE